MYKPIVIKTRELTISSTFNTKENINDIGLKAKSKSYDQNVDMLSSSGRQ